MKKTVSFILSLIIFSAAIFVRSSDKNYITVCFLKTGNSDCIIIKTEESAIMIDTALCESFEYINKKLEDLNIISLDCLILTHYDHDHVGSASKIVKIYNPKKIYVTYDRPKIYSNAHKKYLKTVEEMNLSPIVVRENLSIRYGDTSLEIIPPKSDYYLFNTSNNSSLLVTLSYGSTSFLFGADVERDRIDEILADGISQYDVLKVPHHGWNEENTADLIRAVSPRYSVITNSTGYRKIPATIAALISQGSYIYSTNNGEVTFKCYKNYVAVSQRYGVN